MALELILTGSGLHDRRFISKPKRTHSTVILYMPGNAYGCLQDFRGCGNKPPRGHGTVVAYVRLYVESYIWGAS